MRHRVISVLGPLVLVLPLMAAALSTDTPKSLGAFGSWHAYTYKEDGEQVCYMVEAVRFSKTKKFKRGSSYLMITHRPAENSLDVVSFTSGYNFKPVSDVHIHIGKANFSLFTDKDTGWSHDPQTDRAIVKAIRSGETLTLTGTPAQHGIKLVTDRLSLNGSDLAYQAIGKSCGLEPVTKAKPALTKKKSHK